MAPTLAQLEQAFLDDIVVHPDDPALWLILADWLDDQHDARAGLVRLTWALQHEPDHADFAQRQARLQELLAGGVAPVRPRWSSHGFEFVWIPPGSFLMGSPADEPDRGIDEDQHHVTLTRGFWMGVTPVTQPQWQAVTGSNPSHFARDGAGQQTVRAVSDADLALYPVENVSWQMATDFCAKLGKSLRCDVRRPTEAQWEYACRAGTMSPFHVGTALVGATWNTGHYPESASGLDSPGPAPVARGIPNAWGLHDLHGHVWEWCRDAYRADLGRAPVVDPLVRPGKQADRVNRGGSWFDSPHRARCAQRHQVSRNCGASALGLRVCIVD